MELKLTGIALNRSKNNNRQGRSGRDFFIENSLVFLIEVGIVFSHTNPYNFAVTLKLQRSRKGHSLYLSWFHRFMPEDFLCQWYQLIIGIQCSRNDDWLHANSTFIQYRPSRGLGWVFYGYGHPGGEEAGNSALDCRILKKLQDHSDKPMSGTGSVVDLDQ